MDPKGARQKQNQQRIRGGQHPDGQPIGTQGESEGNN
jgi:hypothetical protein